LSQFGAGVLLDPLWTASKGTTATTQRAAGRSSSFGATLDMIMSNLRTDLSSNDGGDDDDNVDDILKCRRRDSAATLVQLMTIFVSEDLAEWVKTFLEEGLDESLTLQEDDEMTQAGIYLYLVASLTSF
jgi:hypothetical protein